MLPSLRPSFSDVSSHWTRVTAQPSLGIQAVNNLFDIPLRNSPISISAGALSILGATCKQCFHCLSLVAVPELQAGALRNGWRVEIFEAMSVAI
jgi:hypothetical protein